mgnify:CR=1 FL=1
MKYVEWDEPWQMDEESSTSWVGVTSRMTCEDAIRWSKYLAEKFHKDHPKYPYKTDQEALDDFIIINWARIVDVPSG